MKITPDQRLSASRRVYLKLITLSEQWLEILMCPDRDGLTVAETCRRYQISRQTFYEYRRRYLEQGAAGLTPRSRQPRSSPGRTPAEVEALILAIRCAQPRWGARKILAEIRRQGGVQPPATSTIHQVLRRAGLVPGTRNEITGSPPRILHVNGQGVISYRRRKINVGMQHAGRAVQATEDRGIVSIYLGHQLLREVRLGPPATYHGSGKPQGRPRKVPTMQNQTA